MPQTLLSTKLNIPLASHALVPRSELMTTLTKARKYPLTLVSAPPGYGKTTLVSSWLSSAEIPVSWLSLDEGDNDSTRFLEYFLTALHKVVPAVRVDALHLLQSLESTPSDALLALIGNSTADIDDFLLVMDDFQVLQAQPILDLFSLLIDRLPPAMHLVLLSRIDPPLPLSRLRARGQLLEIRAEQLRFSAEEIDTFFDQVMDLKISGPDITAIESRTEGWIAGLQLAGLAIKSTSIIEEDSLHRFITSFTGSHAYIMDYLTEEVLSHQSDSIRSFLLKTSILERMCAPLCEAVNRADIEEPLNCQAVLESFEKNHLFVVPLDSERRWYRFHHLFRDVLYRRLEILFPGQIPGLHRRASEWYEQHGFIHEAVHHAMKAGDSSHTARLVEQYGCTALMAGEITTLAGWLADIEPYTQSRPWLAMQKAWVYTLSGSPKLAQQAIESGELILSTLPPTSDENTLRGSFAAARAHNANLQGRVDLAAEYARQALDFLGESNDFSCSLRSVATSLLGDASWMQGKMTDARQAYSEAVFIGQLAGNPHMVMMSNSSLADVLFEQGKLNDSARVCAEILQMAERIDGPRSAYSQYGLCGLSKVFYARNQLEEATRSIEKCYLAATQWENANLQISCLALNAELELARGNVEEAREIITRVEKQINESTLSPTWLTRNQITLARLWIRMGRMEKVYSLIKNMGICQESQSLDTLQLADAALSDPIPSHLEAPYLILARLLIAQGSPNMTLTVCESLLPNAHSAERVRMETEILILQALAFQLKRDVPRALEALDRAIALAFSEQSKRVFLDEGKEMVKLLYQARARNIGGEFVGELLSDFLQPCIAKPSSPEADQSALIEPLSSRELELLCCIAEGCSNQEIADRCFISPKTVKRHISNIYAKLGAKTRTQAVSLARSLKIIQ